MEGPQGRDASLGRVVGHSKLVDTMACIKEDLGEQKTRCILLGASKWGSVA